MSLCRACLRPPLARAAAAAATSARPRLSTLATRHGEDVLITTVKRRPSPRAHLTARPRVAALSTSAPRQKAILNPRQDDHGNDMDIEITPRAAARLQQIMAKDHNPNVALRITVESGGCHGFQYLMSLTDMAHISRDEDTVFEGAEGAKVVMDEPSLELLKGSRVDYTMELIGSQFKVVNPLATSSCGCGTSFDIKVA